ncbi:MAG: glycosyltransferase [Symploca sp. SIO2C1]|nr:glycosyltransferase [Symploca sp. SIO2C1]
MNQPIISVVIPTYQRNDLLEKCLDCLAPGVQTLPADQYEVIVTDNGSETTAEEMIRERYPWVKWVASPRKGPAANRNNGAQYAQGEWLAFTDDDCLPEPNWLGAFLEATKEGVLALEGAIHPLGNPNQDMAECPVNLTGGCFWSASIAVARSLFETVGGFDPNYPYAAFEDMDLKLRLSPLTKILFVPEARVFHPVRMITLKKSITNIPKRCSTWAYHINKHRKVLGYEQPLSFTMSRYKNELLHLWRNLKEQRVKSACNPFFMLLFGIPLILVYLHHLEKQN